MYLKHIILKEIRVRIYPEGGLDLFSGGDSWRETVKSAGFRYGPVDIRPLCTLRW